jgi:precorrin-6B methylase 2
MRYISRRAVGGTLLLLAGAAILMGIITAEALYPAAYRTDTKHDQRPGRDEVTGQRRIAAVPGQCSGPVSDLTRGIGAKRVVEFGASFGISTLYLAAAVRANGGSRVITTEIEPSKCRAAEDNVRRAGLDDIVEVREGDAMRTLEAIDGPVDLVFLDGWKDLYLPVLDLLRPRLRPGAMVLADNVNLPETRPYLAHVRGGHGFESALLPGGRMEASFFLPA